MRGDRPDLDMSEAQLHRTGGAGRILVKSGSQTKRVAEI
jgi:hypothetical protein